VRTGAQNAAARAQEAARNAHKIRYELLRILRRLFSLGLRGHPGLLKGRVVVGFRLGRRDVASRLQDRRFVETSPAIPATGSTASNDRHGPRRWMTHGPQVKTCCSSASSRLLRKSRAGRLPFNSSVNVNRQMDGHVFSDERRQPFAVFSVRHLSTASR
jgi:hypothetical protein